MRVNYSLGTLVHGAVTDVTIDALELPLALHGGKLNIGPLAQVKTSAKPGAARLARLPFRRVDLHRSALVLDWEGRRLVLPVEGTLVSADGTIANLDLRAQIAEVEFQLSGKYDLATGDYEAMAKTASDADLATLAGLLPRELFDLPGRIDGQAALVAAIKRDATGTQTIAGMRGRSVGFDGQLGALPVQCRDVALGAELRLDSHFVPTFVDVNIQGGSGRIAQYDITSWSARFMKPAGNEKVPGDPGTPGASERMSSLIASVATVGAEAQIAARIDGLGGTGRWNDLRIDTLLRGSVDVGYWLGQLPAAGVRASGEKATVGTRMQAHVFRAANGKWNWDARSAPLGETSGGLAYGGVQVRNLSIELPNRAGRLDGIRVTAPFEFTADRSHVEVSISGTAALDDVTIEAPPMRLQLKRHNPQTPMLTLGTAEAQAKLLAGKGTDGRWNWHLAAPNLRAILAESSLQWSGGGAAAGKLSAAAQSVLGHVNLALKADATGAQVESLPDSVLSAANLTGDFWSQHLVTGPAKFELAGRPSKVMLLTSLAGGWKADVPFTISADSLTATLAGGVEANVPAVQLGGHIGLAGNAAPTASANLSFKNAALLCRQAGLTAGDVSGQIPLSWNTAAPSSAASQYEIKSVVVKDRELGSITGTASVDGLKAALTARWLLPGGGILAGTGWADLSGPMPTGAFIGKMPETSITEENVLARLLGGSLGDLTFTGKVGLEVGVKLDRGRIEPLIPAASSTQPNMVRDEELAKGLVRVTVSDADAASKKKAMSVTGLAGSATINSFNPLTTPGRQVWKARSVTIGSFTPTDLTMAFRMEDPHSILVERLATTWAGGRIHTYALRFNPAKPQDIRLTLYFEDIDLQKFFTAVAPNHISGQGLLYGRLPMTIKWPQISFGNGFLYAAPGPGHLTFADAQAFAPIANAVVDSSLQGQTEQLKQTVKRQIVSALTDIEYSRLTIDLLHDQRGLVAKLEVGGRGRQVPEQGIKRLTVNLVGFEDALAFYLGNKDLATLFKQ